MDSLKLTRARLEERGVAGARGTLMTYRGILGNVRSGAVAMASTLLLYLGVTELLGSASTVV